MEVVVTSFSYKCGLPENKTGNGNATTPSGVGLADERSEELSQRESRKSPRGFVFDCRAMPNPFGDESLRGYTGRDKPIADFFAIHKDKVDCFLGALFIRLPGRVDPVGGTAKICRHLLT